MMNIVSFADKTPEFVAEFLYATLMGFRPETVDAVEDDEPIVDEPTFDENDELVGYYEVAGHDHEQERYVKCEICCGEGWTPTGPCTECHGRGHWFDDPSTVAAYFTTSGDNPVLWDEAHIIDEKRSAGGWSDVDPDYNPVAWFCCHKGGLRKQHHTFAQWMVFIHKHRNNRAKLFSGWAQWKRNWDRIVGRGLVTKRQGWAIRQMFLANGCK